MNRNELRELMECCRSDLDNLSDPERSALIESLERDADIRGQWSAVCAWDKVLGEAMRDVSLPSGLAGRLAAAVAAHDGDQTASAAAQEAARSEETTETRDAESEDHCELPKRATGTSRRWLSWPIAVPLGLAATAALVALIAWVGPWGNDLDSRQVAQIARGWLEELGAESWQQNAPPRDQYPVDPSLRFPVVGWQRFVALEDSQAVAYQGVVPPDSSDAYLLVVRTRKGRKLAPIPPTVPVSTTGNMCVGVWKSNGCLYVLLVKGNRQRYRRVLRINSFAARGFPDRPRFS